MINDITVTMITIAKATSRAQDQSGVAVELQEFPNLIEGWCSNKEGTRAKSCHQLIMPPLQTINHPTGEQPDIIIADEVPQGKDPLAHTSKDRRKRPFRVLR